MGVKALEICDFDNKRLAEILSSVGSTEKLHDRIEAISSLFVDCPYKASPLIGSKSEEEQLSIPLDCFDCVTLKETVLAAAFAKSEAEFIDYLTRLRYEGGMVDWLHRNHYSIDWIRRNEEAGFVKNITPQEGANVEERTLSLLEDYPARSHTISYFPADQLSSFSSELRTGDLIYFGTTRKDLDVAHVGFFIQKSDDAILRHSTKSKGATIDEPLSDFLARFGDTPGLIFVRPLSQ